MSERRAALLGLALLALALALGFATLVLLVFRGPPWSTSGYRHHAAAPAQAMRSANV